MWSLSKKKSRHQVASVAVAPEPAAAPIRRTQLLKFLEHHALALALCLIALAALRMVSAYSVFGNVGDEPAHLACGLQYLAQHVYRYESQHPPLARAMLALGPYLAGLRPLGFPHQDQEGVQLIYRSGNPDRILMLMRLGILPFFLLACFVVFLWARHHFGGATAVVATSLFTMIPPVLAHGMFATTDMPLTACLGAAFLSLIIWAESPSWKHGLLLGLTAALAALTKFTSLGYLPAAAMFALIAYLAVERPGREKLASLAKERAPSFGIGVLAGALLIWAAYFFRIGKVPVWNVTLPAPEFFDGIRVAMAHNVNGHPAYLLGEMGTRGWWYFFPVALGVKTPLALLLLLLFGVYVCWTKRAALPYLLPLAFSLGILLPAMTSHVNIGVRHVLPIYIGFAILGAIAVVQLIEKRLALVAGALVAWLAVAGAWRHPDYLPYFNELVRHPENVLLDSDYDWGQDQKRLARRLRELGAGEVSFGWFGDDQSLWPELPPTKRINPLEPAEGWTAVSPTLAKTRQYGLDFRYPDLKPWFEYIQPKERVGSLLLYYVPPGSLPRKPR